MTSKFKLNQVLIAACIAAGVGALGYGIAGRNSSGAKPASVAAVSKLAVTVNAAKKDALELKIPTDYITVANITVENMSGSDVCNELLLPVVVTAVSDAEVVMVSRANGTLVRVLRRLGDTVKAGEVLASIESLEAAIIVGDRRVTQAKVDLACKTLAREKSLLDQGITPRQTLEVAQVDVDIAGTEAQRAAAVAGVARVGGDGRSLNIVASIAGRITSITAPTGAHVTSDLELFHVGMPGTVQIEAPLTVDDLCRVAVGDSATVLTRFGKPVPVTVRGLTPGISATTRVATIVFIPMAGSGAQLLLAGEGVQVRPQTRGQPTPQGIAVSGEAVQNIDGIDVVFLRTPEGSRVQQIYVGPRSDGLAQIVIGLKSDQQVAVRNAFLPRAEAKELAGDDE